MAGTAAGTELGGEGEEDRGCASFPEAECGVLGVEQGRV